ncbi:MAG: hypothetical protein ACP5JM_06385 [Thermoplasmata archaeon]
MRIIRLLPIIAIFYSWSMIILSIVLNPWFIFQRDAFSSLGSDNANYPFVYNILAMVVTGIIISSYSIYGIKVSRNRLENAGYSFL